MKIKLNPTTILIALGILLCFCYFFGRGCAGKSHKSDSVEVKQQVKNAQVVDLTYKIKYDSMQQVDAKRADLIDSLQVVNDHLHAQLSTTKGKVITYIDAAKKHDDQFIPNCDSLANEASRLLFETAQQENNFKEIDSNFKEQLGTKDSIIAAHVEQYAMIRQSFNDVAGKYETLNKDYVKANRQVKVQRTIGRVLAGAVIVLAGKIILSK